MAAQAPARSVAGPALEHSAQVHARLRRAEGQIGGILRMYEQGRPCSEILDQLASARAALDALGLLILEDHVRCCLEPVLHDSVDEARAAQLLLAVRRFVRSG